MAKILKLAAAPALAAIISCGGNPQEPKLPQTTLESEDQVCGQQLGIVNSVASTLVWKTALGAIITKKDDPKWEKAVENCLKLKPEFGDNLAKEQDKVAELEQAADIKECKSLQGSEQTVCLAMKLTETVCASTVMEALNDLITAQGALYSCANPTDASDELSIRVSRDAIKYNNQEWASVNDFIKGLAARLGNDFVSSPVKIDMNRLKTTWHPLQCAPIDNKGNERPIATYDLSKCSVASPAEPAPPEPAPAKLPLIDLTVGILEFDDTMIRRETNEIMADPHKGLTAINKCITQAAEGFTPAERGKFDIARANAKTDYLFWLGRSVIENIGEKAMAEFAERYRACLRK